jgi:glutathione-regulated potassium-efflux system ancillary protein KefF
VIEQTARFCDMHWAEPLTIYGSHRIDDAALSEYCASYRQRLQTLSARAAKE